MFYKGYHHSEEVKQKISIAKMGKKNPFYGKHLTEEHKNKIRKSTKGKIFSEETKKKLSLALNKRIKIACKLCGKEKYVQRSIIKKGSGKFCSYKCNCIWHTKNSKKNKDTSIEKAIEQELIKRNIPYLKQAPIEGIALVDFLLSNKIIIQCDGDYWHSKKINKGRDIAQDTVLYFKGYKVFRFWEKDIKKSPKKCINKMFQGGGR